MWLRNGEREFEVDDKSVDLINRLKGEGFEKFTPKPKKETAPKPESGSGSGDTGSTGDNSANDSGNSGNGSGDPEKTGDDTAKTE